jgi:TIR domain
VTQIFLSYSSQDYFFAEMLAIKLQEKNGFRLWRDLGSIRAGDDWRQSIESGIKESVAVVVALSAYSAASAYVTYEWAYTLGMSKPVIPVKLSDCKFHPRLEPTHYVDFSYPRSLPWSELIKRLEEVEVEKDPEPKSVASTAPARPIEDDAIDKAAKDVLSYLNQKGLTRASFERLRQKEDLRKDPSLSDEIFDAIIARNPGLFRHATIKGGKPGIAKQVP